MDTPGTTPFTIPPSWATVRIPWSRNFGVVMLTNPQTTEKWPPTMAQHLQALMLQHRLFAVHKRRPETVATLERIVEELYSYFDPPLDHAHLGAFVEKTTNKITRIRTELLSQGTLEKTDTGFVLSSHKSTEAPARLPSLESRRRLQLQQWIQQHQPSISSRDSDIAIDVFLYQTDLYARLADHTIITRAES